MIHASRVDNYEKMWWFVQSADLHYFESLIIGQIQRILVSVDNFGRCFETFHQVKDPSAAQSNNASIWSF